MIPGLHALAYVIECLRKTGTFTDEEGELTNDLADLLKYLEPKDEK